MRRNDILEAYLAKYFLCGRRRKTRSTCTVVLYALADVLKPYIIPSVSLNTCPYCGRRFTSKTSLRKHLRTRCWPSLKTDIGDVIDAFTYISTRCVHIWSDSLKIKRIRVGDLVEVRSKTELSKWIRENPEVVRAWLPTRRR